MCLSRREDCGGLIDSDHSPGWRRDKLHRTVEHAAHLLPRQGPIGVFVHHNTLHAFEDRPFEEAVIDASNLFCAEPYMSEAAYRSELARGRILPKDIDAVLDSEPAAIVFPRLSRRSLRRAMITPGVREFDAAGRLRQNAEEVGIWVVWKSNALWNRLLP